jgi:hypothetical protein
MKAQLMETIKSNWVIRTNDFKSSPLKHAELVACKESESLIKGVKDLLKFWGLALLCIFIPVLHFFLVPSFLLLGIYMLFKGIKYKFRVQTPGTEICPACQKPLDIKSMWLESSIRFSCQHCATQLVLEKQSS